jgi:hypothetical protein
LAKKVGGKEKREVGETLDVKWVSRRRLADYVSSWSLEAFNQVLSSDKRVKFFTEKSFPIPFSKLPIFIWRRTIGKSLKLVKV